MVKEAAPSPKKRDIGKSQVAKPAKRERAVATPMSKMSSKQIGIELGDVILAKAREAGYESQLKNLALRPDVVASGNPADKLLEALEASNGLVNQAKRALLGA